MNNLEKLYYNMDKLSDECRDLEDTKEARDAMEKAIGAEVYEKAEDEICCCMSANGDMPCSVTTRFWLVV